MECADLSALWPARAPFWWPTPSNPRRENAQATPSLGNDSSFRGQAPGCGLVFVFAQLAIEGARGNAENGRGPFAIPITLFQHAEYVLALQFFQSSGRCL